MSNCKRCKTEIAPTSYCACGDVFQDKRILDLITELEGVKAELFQSDIELKKVLASTLIITAALDSERKRADDAEAVGNAKAWSDVADFIRCMVVSDIATIERQTIHAEIKRSLAQYALARCKFEAGKYELEGR